MDTSYVRSRVEWHNHVFTVGDNRRMKTSGQRKTQDDWWVLEASDLQEFIDKHLFLFSTLSPKTLPNAKQILNENPQSDRNPT